MTNVKIYGERELDLILRQLPEKMRGRLIVQGLRRAVKPMTKYAKSIAPKRTGTTSKAITTVIRSRTHPEVWIAPTKGKNAKYDAWYAKFPELGTQKLQPVGFMKNAFESKINEVRENQRKELSVVVLRFLKRKAPKYYVN